MGKKNKLLTANEKASENIEKKKKKCKKIVMESYDEANTSIVSNETKNNGKNNNSNIDKEQKIAVVKSNKRTSQSRVNEEDTVASEPIQKNKKEKKEKSQVSDTDSHTIQLKKMKKLKKSTELVDSAPIESSNKSKKSKKTIPTVDTIPKPGSGNKKILFDDEEPQEVPEASGNTTNTMFLNEDEVKDEDIDKFCDEIDEEDNKQFDDWVKLLEAKLGPIKKVK